MRLYSGPLSLFTAKVRVALAEKNLAYEKISVGWSRADRYRPHHPDVVALNPKAEVPVLVDGDLTVYDSTLILEYLEDRYPETPLFPSDPGRRAECRQWEAAADEILFPHVWSLIESRFYPADPAGSDATNYPEAPIHAYQGLLDKALAGREFLCGAFSVADIGNYIMLSTTVTLGVPVAPDHAHLAAWITRVGNRESIGKEIQEMNQAAAAAMAG